jgi:hypothetical protein
VLLSFLVGVAVMLSLFLVSILLLSVYQRVNLTLFASACAVPTNYSRYVPLAVVFDVPNPV